MMNDEWKSKNNLSERCYRFSLEIIRLVLELPNNLVGREIGKQLIRCGLSIGANVEEAEGALTKKDFTHGMNISKKEARETKYWLRIIVDSELASKKRVEPLMQENGELIRILTSIVKTAQGKKKT